MEMAAIKIAAAIANMITKGIRCCMSQRSSAGAAFLATHLGGSTDPDWQSCRSSHWRKPVRREISFYSYSLKKQISGSYSVENGMVTVHSLHGQKSTQVGGHAFKEELLARRLLIELESEYERHLGAD